MLHKESVEYKPAALSTEKGFVDSARVLRFSKDRSISSSTFAPGFVQLHLGHTDCCVAVHVQCLGLEEIRMRRLPLVWFIRSSNLLHPQLECSFSGQLITVFHSVVLQEKCGEI